MNDAFVEQTRSEGLTILRVAKELREWIAAAPTDDDAAQSLRRDCDTLVRVGTWLSTSHPITCQDGIDAAGPIQCSTTPVAATKE